MSLCRRLIAHGGTHGKAILYMLSMRPSGEKHADVDFSEFLLIIFYRQDTHQKVSCQVSFFISKAWVVIWYNYYYYSRMRKTHTFCALLSGFEGYYIIVEWEKRTYFDYPPILFTCSNVQAVHVHFSPCKATVQVPIQVWLPQLPSASQTMVLAVFFAPWIEKSLTPWMSMREIL